MLAVIFDLEYRESPQNYEAARLTAQDGPSMYRIINHPLYSYLELNKFVFTRLDLY